MQVQPYLFFNGDCEAAMDFYTAALGSEVTFVMRFKEAPPSPEHPVPAGWEEKIMHANVKIGDSQVMFSDCHPDQADARKGGFSLSITAASVAEGEALFNKLAAGGAVHMPFQATFWSPGFGMLADKFGVPWMVNCLH